MSAALTALDARNPLAFMAALGALRLAVMGSQRGPTLHWIERGATWTPVLDGDEFESLDAAVNAIARGHEARDLEVELGWERDVMKLSRQEVRRFLSERLDHGSESAAWVAACVAELPTRRSGDAPYTPFRVLPRVGRARFLESAQRLSRLKSLERSLHDALEGPWRYTKANNLSWDPGAQIPARAYGAEAPTDFGPLAVPGAMLLAVAALPLFPLMPTASAAHKGVACRGFGQSNGRDLRWPIWSRPAHLPAIRLLLGMPELYKSRPDQRVLERHGIVARLVAERTSFGSDATVLSWGAPNVALGVQAGR